MPRMDLQQLLDTLAPEAPLAQRHLWLMDALAWVRGDAAEVATSVERVRAFVSALEADPALRERWHRWLRAFIATVDLTPLLADFGFAPRTAFLSEFGHRLRRKLLPGTPETRDLADLFSLLLPTRFDVRWIKALDTTTLQRLGATLPGQAEPVWNDALMDALTCCVSQVSATGWIDSSVFCATAKMRSRSSGCRVNHSAPGALNWPPSLRKPSTSDFTSERSRPSTGMRKNGRCMRSDSIAARK